MEHKKERDNKAAKITRTEQIGKKGGRRLRPLLQRGKKKKKTRTQPRENKKGKRPD